MNNIVYRTLTRRCSVKRGDTLIVALSGGADSVSLLNVLLDLKDTDLELEVMAAHVNHKLRGEESDRDEQFVRRLCEQRGVTLFVHSEDVGALSALRRQSVELCGREVRYDFFRELSLTYNAKIATAHTLSDSEETMLYNISRGTSLHGLCSIPYTRDEIIRPLLDVTREQVERYCAENSLSFVQDSTNYDEEVCKRNKIRLSVLPPLRSLNDGFHGNFRRLRANLINVDDYMHETARKALDDCRTDFGYSAVKLSALHRAVLDYCISLIISDAGAKAENKHLALCRSILSGEGAVMLPAGFSALCTQGVFRVVNSGTEENALEIPLTGNMDFCFGDKEYTLQVLNIDSIVYKKLASSCIACDKINSGAVIRTRREGDTFTLLKRGITKPLRKLQNELKIPAELRKRSLVVAKGSTVLWAEYIGVSAQGAVEDTAKEGIYISRKDMDENA